MSFTIKKFFVSLDALGIYLFEIKTHKTDQVGRFFQTFRKDINIFVDVHIVIDQNRLFISLYEIQTQDTTSLLSPCLIIETTFFRLIFFLRTHHMEHISSTLCKLNKTRAKNRPSLIILIHQ
ncbi:hypothetical protein CDIK_1403 [Cucumispora dikerogammari]|nr:hypothetical protein CDIK_1403 [Cucumispora dikerogammari]